jgi:hypothetical protein
MYLLRVKLIPLLQTTLLYHLITPPPPTLLMGIWRRQVLQGFLYTPPAARYHGIPSCTFLTDWTRKWTRARVASHQENS